MTSPVMSTLLAFPLIFTAYLWWWTFISDISYLFSYVHYYSVLVVLSGTLFPRYRRVYDDSGCAGHQWIIYIETEGASTIEPSTIELRPSNHRSSMSSAIDHRSIDIGDRLSKLNHRHRRSIIKSSKLGVCKRWTGLVDYWTRLLCIMMCVI